MKKEDEQKLLDAKRSGKLPPLSASELKKYAERIVGHVLSDKAWEDFCWNKLGMCV